MRNVNFDDFTGKTFKLTDLPGNVAVVPSRKDEHGKMTPRILCEATIEMAEGIMRQDGHHVPMFNIFTPDYTIMWQVTGMDSPEKKEAVGLTVRSIIAGSKVFAVVTIMESWMKVLKDIGPERAAAFVKDYRPGQLQSDLEAVEALVVTAEYRDRGKCMVTSQIERGMEGEVVGFKRDWMMDEKQNSPNMVGNFAGWFDNPPTSGTERRRAERK